MHWQRHRVHSWVRNCGASSRAVQRASQLNASTLEARDIRKHRTWFRGAEVREVLGLAVSAEACNRRSIRHFPTWLRQRASGSAAELCRSTVPFNAVVRECRRFGLNEACERRQSRRPEAGASVVASSFNQVGDQLASGPANDSASELTIVLSSAAERRSPWLRAAVGFSSGWLRSAFRSWSGSCFPASSNCAFQPTRRACHGAAVGCSIGSRAARLRWAPWARLAAERVHVRRTATTLEVPQ